MDTSVILARFFGIFLFVVGFSMLQKKEMLNIVDRMMKDEALVWVSGLLALIMGAASLSLYDAWTPHWPVILTILGCLAVLKGVAILFVPDFLSAWYKKSSLASWMMFAGLLSIVIGAFLLYKGFVV